MKKYIDITLPLQNGLASWPGDSKPALHQPFNYENGDPFSATEYSGSLHWGTHIDAPYHLNPAGWTIAEIPLEVLIGPCEVVDCTGHAKITANLLREKITSSHPRILLKTDSGIYWKNTPNTFRKDFVSLTEDAADFILQKKIELVGIDYMSLDFYDASEYPVHKKLYAQNVIGLENLYLHTVRPGCYKLICLPLNIAGSDGSPARVLLSPM